MLFTAIYYTPIFAIIKNYLMKSVLLLLVSCAVLGNVAFGQGFYARLGLGYAVPQAGQTMDGTATPYNGVSSNFSSAGVDYTSYDIKSMSFTSGIHGTIGAGYMFNRHIGIDASFDFLASGKKYTYTDENVIISKVTYNIDIVDRAKATLFVPALVLQTDGAKANVYTRLGIVLPLNTRITQDQIFTNLPGAGAVVREDDGWEIKNKFSLGFSGAAGIKLAVNTRTNFWAEVGFLSLSMFAKESNRTSLDITENGVYQGNYNSQVAADKRKIVYSNKFTGTSGDFYHQPTFSQPFSNASFSIGFSYELRRSEPSRGERGRNDVKSRRR